MESNAARLGIQLKVFPSAVLPAMLGLEPRSDSIISIPGLCAVLAGDTSVSMLVFSSS